MYIDQWEPIVIYHSIFFTGPYTTILTPTTVVQGVDNHSWGLYCRRCYCIRVCWGRSSRIFHFSRWLGQLSTVITKDESPHTGYTFTPWVVFFYRPFSLSDLATRCIPNELNNVKPMQRQPSICAARMTVNRRIFNVHFSEGTGFVPAVRQ